MTVWRKLENEECYAVAIYNYSPSTTPHLELEVGELVHLERETDEWYWGTSIRRDASGAFPKSYVHIRECNVERCGETVVASAGGSGVAHEIALTLREWIHHWKKLYLTNDDRFKFMEVSMRALLELRGQAASSALPQDQLRKTSRTAIFTIDKGNRTLGMELAMRNSNGKLVNPLTISTYRLNALHEETNMRIDKNMEVIPPGAPSTRTQPSGAARTYTLVVRVHNFVCRLTDAAELQLALHDSECNKLTEHLLLRWPQSQPGSSQAVFTDLGPDVKREKVFLVCHVVRIGGLDQAQDHRRSSVAMTPAPVTAAGVRRPFGVACGDVTKQMAADAPDKHVQLPFYPCEKEYMDHLLKKVIVNRDMKDTKHTQGLWISLQLVEGNLKQIREENPHLVVGSTAVARKMGFPEVIMPGDARNDLYVTICNGSFSKGGGKSSERNIELTARVVDRHGNTMPGVISIGAGVPLVDEYTSLVYYHDDRPRWQEVFKVCLNIEEFKEAHLVFLYRHRSSNEAKDRAEKFFALSYLRLMQREGTTTPDKLHTLCVYKIDNKRGGVETEREGAASCVALPSRRDELPAGAERGLTRGVLALVHRDSLSVLTKLCSTKLTQREEILGVLKWSTQHAEGSLRAALRRLLSTPSEELVKFLQDILDALFNILTQVPEEKTTFSEDSYAVLVLECLLCVISLVADHKYQHFQPVLHVYIDKSFCDALAYEKLIAVIVWVIQSADRGETELKRLLQCMKCLECLVRFIVRSRELRRALGDRAADDDFYYQFQSLMEAIIWLMRCGDAALTCQGSALKYLPHAIPHAIKVFPQSELSAAVVRALEALPLSRLGKQRMSSLLEVVRGPLCASPSARAALLPHLAHTLAHLLRTKMELDREMAHKSRSVDKAARLLGADSSRLHDPNNFQHIVELCIETLGEVVTLLARDDIGPVESDRGDLARRLLPTVLGVTAAMLRDRSTGQVDDALLRETVSILLDMVRQMSAEQYSAVVVALEAEGGGAGTLVADALALMTALLNRPVFGAHWADMLHLQHSVMLHALKLLSTTLCERLQPLDPQGQVEPVYSMWRDWFNTLASVATSPVLQLETLSAARRQRALALYGDLRRDAAHAVSEMWFNLGEHKRAFIPCLVEPVLKVSFLRDEEVRTTTIPLLFDMMQTEYNYNVANGETEGHLRELESELIDKVDRLVECGCGDAAWRARFVALCGARCVEAGGALRDAAGALVAAGARQLDALLQYRAPHASASAALRMQLTSRVLLFYEQIERPHMYIRYVHKLAEMHRGSGQWAEAGLALRLHATLLAWSSDPLPQRLQRPTHCPSRHATQRDLKEELYREVVDLLDRGHQWEIAVEIVKELVTVYEEESLGYGILAQLHETLARLYTAMLRTARMHPSYFRVIYYGKGFPEHLRVEEGFVYRGNEYEQLGDFKERLLDEWPEAEVLPKLDPPGEDITESEGQYFQINAVEPVMGDKLKRVSGKPIAEQILQYYKYNHVDKFIFSRPFHRPEESLDGSTDDVSSQNEFATRWLERTELEISDKLPGILRWFPVVSKRTFWVSPLEAAVEALRNSNRDLKALILGAKAAHAPLQPLTMRLSGILDPAVQGGVVNYERAFLTPAYEARHPDHAQLLQDLKDLIAAQIPLLKYGLEVHAARIPVELEALHDHMKTCFNRIQHHVHQRYGRKACDLESESPEVQLRANLRDSLADVSAPSNRISDISTGTDSALKSKFFSFNSAINPLVRNSSGGVVTNYFNTLNTPKKKREQKRSRKSEVVTSPSSGSQWYTSSHSAPNGVATPTVNPTPAALLSQPDTPTVSPLRELRQPLMTERPLRAEAERERRLSQRASFLTSSAPHSNRDSFGTTDSNQEEEEPPPLPQKSHRSIEPEDNNNNPPNNNDNPPRYNYDTVFVPRGSFLYSSMANRRHTTTNGNKPPTPPPKKKNIQNNP